jgi:hypothetical protein
VTTPTVLHGQSPKLLTREQLLCAYAITLQNPWGHLIAHHGKDVENRGWMPYQGVDWLLIHAGKGWDGSPNFPDPSLRTSAIVATAFLPFACDASLNSDTVICGCGPWAAANNCHWRLGGVWTLPEPVPVVRGFQRLWRPGLDVLDRIESQLALARG